MCKLSESWLDSVPKTDFKRIRNLKIVDVGSHILLKFAFGWFRKPLGDDLCVPVASSIGVPARKKLFFWGVAQSLSAASHFDHILCAFWEPVAAFLTGIASLSDGFVTYRYEFIRLVCHCVCVCARVCLCLWLWCSFRSLLTQKKRKDVINFVL